MGLSVNAVQAQQVIHSHLLPLEQHFLFHREYLVYVVSIVSLILVLLGWLYSSYRARALQRKQLAIGLLNDNRYEKVWVDAKRDLFRGFRVQDEEYWTNLCKKKYDLTQTLTPDEEKLIHDMHTVMNTFEFISIGILNKAIDEDIIKWSYEYFYETCNTRLSGYIKEAISSSDDSLFCNFRYVAKKWKIESAHAEKVASPEKNLLKKIYRKVVVYLYTKLLSKPD